MKTLKEEEAGFSFSMVTPNSRKEQKNEQGLRKPSRKQSDPGMISLLIQVESPDRAERGDSREWFTGGLKLWTRGQLRDDENVRQESCWRAQPLVT